MSVVAKGFGLLGLAVLGGVAGAILGVLCGFAYTSMAHTSNFEGYSGMLVFFTFGPAGAIILGIGLPAAYAVHLARRE